MNIIVLVIHILSVIVAVGAATATDYLHLVGLRKKRLERQLRHIYPNLTHLITFALVMIYITGLLLIIGKPELLRSTLFQTKIIFVLIITANGIYLHNFVSPQVDICVMKGRKYCTNTVLYTSAISGCISIVTWYAIVILSLTKTEGYTAAQFLGAYGITLLVCIGIALHYERKARKWHEEK